MLLADGSAPSALRVEKIVASCEALAGEAAARSALPLGFARRRAPASVIVSPSERGAGLHAPISGHAQLVVRT